MDPGRLEPSCSGAKPSRGGGRSPDVQRVPAYTLQMLAKGRLVFAGLMLLSACSGATDLPQREAAAPSSTVSSSLVTTPEQAAVPTPTVESAAPVPLPDNFGDDFRHILTEIAAFESYLAQHPDPAQLALIYALECPCFEAKHALLKELADSAHQFSGDTTHEIVTVSFVSNADGLAQVLVSGKAPGGSVVNNEGAVQRAVPAADFNNSVFLELGQDGRWRILAVDPVTIDPPAFDSLDSESAGG